jgi:ubiquitin-protein ligase
MAQNASESENTRLGTEALDIEASTHSGSTSPFPCSNVLKSVKNSYANNVSPQTSVIAENSLSTSSPPPPEVSKANSTTTSDTPTPTADSALTNPDLQTEESASADKKELAAQQAPVRKSLIPSSSAAHYNMRSPAVKRIMREALENSREDQSMISVAPLADNIFEWHFTFRGPPGTAYELGMYHGRIVLPTNYPMAPPNIILLNASGRFDINVKICLSISSYHPETWQPSWSVRTALTALRAFMETDSPGAIGSIQCSDEVRKDLAKKSRFFKCPSCGYIFQQLDRTDIDNNPELLPVIPRELRQQVGAMLRTPFSVVGEAPNPAEHETIGDVEPEEQFENSIPLPLEAMMRNRVGVNRQQGMDHHSQPVRANSNELQERPGRRFTILIWGILTLIGCLIIRRFCS